MPEQQSEKDVWLDVSKQALEQTESDFSEEPEEIEGQATDEPDVLESGAEGDEDQTTDEAEVVEDGGDEADDPVVYEWDGDPNKLPEPHEHDGVKYDLKATHKSMQGGHTKAMQELAEFRKGMIADNERLRAENAELVAKARVVDDPEPANPGPDVSQEDYVVWQKKQMAWSAREEQRKAIDSGAIPDPHRQQQQIAEYEASHRSQQLVAFVRAQEGWTQQLEDRMGDMLQTDPFWATAPRTEEAIGTLFGMVKGQADAAEIKVAAAAKETEKVRRKAKSARNAVGRTGGSPSKVTAESYKNKGFKELNALALEIDAGAED